MNKRKGISIASVMIATLLIIFLTTTITISVSKVSENADKMAFASEINSLQITIDSYYLANKEYPILDENVILDISQIEDKEEFNGESITNNKLILSKIDYDKIEYISLRYGINSDEREVYAISTTTGRVYYVKGMKFSGKIYFTLTQDLKTFLLNGRNSNIDTNSPVIFTPSKVSWSNEAVEVLVKVPTSYKSISVIVGDTSYSLINEENGYYLYSIKQEGNYTVQVNYLDSSNIQKTATYSVKNFDIEKPVIEIDNHVVLSEDYNNEIYGYYNITKAEDNASGIKKIKYEYGQIKENINSYFNTNGQVVMDNRITIRRGYEYITIYIEDNAGNYNVLYIKI